MQIEKISEDKYVCDKPRLTIITFDEIFKLVVIHVINIIYNIYGNLEPINKLNQDAKKIFIHAILTQIYERMLKENERNVILYINTKFTTVYSEIWDYTDKSKLEKFIIKTCKSISNKAPLPILVDTNNIDLSLHNGETTETINKLHTNLSQFKNEITSLHKLKKYSKDNGLMQFMDKYHHESEIKNNMFYYKYLKGATNEQI